MKTLIIVSSTYHGNTMKVANAMAQELKAAIKCPQEMNSFNLSSYDLIGLGSGINFSSHHKDILSLVEELPIMGKNVFIFSTRCRPVLGSYHKKLKSLIVEKGGILVGEFSCVGFDHTGPWVGMDGYNKNRPNDKDLFKAKLFASQVRRKAHPLANFKHLHSLLSTFKDLPLRTDGINNVVGNIVLLNTSACIACGKCVRNCPMNVFSMEENVKTPLPLGEQDCIMCGKCEKDCSDNAVFINETFSNGLRILFRESFSDKLQKAYWKK